MSTFVDPDGVIHDIPGVVIDVEVSDEQLVSDAIEARQTAEGTEEEASPSRWREADDYAELVRRGWTKKRIADEVGVSRTSVSLFVACATRYLGNARPSFWHAYQGAKNGNAEQVGNNTGRIEWFTPAEYIQAAVRLMGGIDLDPASTAEANEVVGAAHFYTAEDDGLSQSWAGRVWMNPPYAAGLIAPFCQRLADSYATGDVTEACALVNSATETAWFHVLADQAAAMCFPLTRVKFWHPDKDAAAGPLQGQTVFYFGANVRSFRAEFARFGFTVTL